MQRGSKHLKSSKEKLSAAAIAAHARNSRIKEENVFRTIVVCFNHAMIDQAKYEYMKNLHENGFKYIQANNIIEYKVGRSNLQKIMFLTPLDERRIIGRRYNELKIYDRANEHPKFHDFIREIEPYRVLNLFLGGEEENAE